MLRPLRLDEISDPPFGGSEKPSGSDEQGINFQNTIQNRAIIIRQDFRFQLKQVYCKRKAATYIFVVMILLSMAILFSSPFLLFLLPKKVSKKTTMGSVNRVIIVVPYINQSSRALCPWTPRYLMSFFAFKLVTQKP